MPSVFAKGVQADYADVGIVVILVSVIHLKTAMVVLMLVRRLR